MSALSEMLVVSYITLVPIVFLAVIAPVRFGYRRLGRSANRYFWLAAWSIVLLWERIRERIGISWDGLRSRIICWWTYPLSSLIDLLTVRYDRFSIGVLRGIEFNTSAKPTTKHSHPNAQSMRINGIRTINDAAEKLGCGVYARSTCTRETNRGWSGDRGYYTVADIQFPVRVDEQMSSDIEAYVDVDYYVGESDLFRTTCVKALYTVAPDDIAGQAADSFWYMDKDSIYHEHVSGGAVYSHQVWDFTPDQVVATGWFSTTRYQTVVVKGEHNRAIVFLAPSYTTYIPSFLLGMFIHLPRLERMKVMPLGPGHLAMRSVRERTTVVCVRSIEPGPDSAVVSSTAWEAMRDNASDSKFHGIAGIRCIADRMNESHVPDRELYILMPALKFPLGNGDIVNYTFSPADDPGKPFVSITAPPLVTPAAGATEHRTNVERSVDERVLAVRNTAVPDKKYHRYAVEFNKCIIPDGVKLTPLTEEEACEALGKTPVQKARMKRNSKKLPGNEPQKVKSFVKKEAATDSAEKGKPNRMIFPVEDEVLIQAARFTIPLKKYLAQRSRDCTYFGTVGLNPTETAIKVREFCKSVTGEVGQTDFSKMDGTHGEFDTGQYIWMYRRAYPRRYHSEIERFMKAHNHRTITTPSCQPDVKPGRINSKWMNLSGKMDTTEANLWRNGFVDYCALREGGLDTDEAFKKIGPKLGDDGLCEMHDQVKVAEDLGFKLKFENAEGGASAVTYLSRIYVAPRVSLYSMADPKRALSRIPVTVNSNVAAGRANKVAGYLITDRDTPVLGEYCRAIQRIYKDVADEKSATPDELRKLSADPYPPCDCRDAAVDVVAKSLGIGADEVLSLEDSLRHVEDVKGLESLRLPGSEPKLHPGATPVASAR